jgi:hypothetical protein
MRRLLLSTNLERKSYVAIAYYVCVYVQMNVWFENFTPISHGAQHNIGGLFDRIGHLNAMKGCWCLLDRNTPIYEEFCNKTTYIHTYIHTHTYIHVNVTHNLKYVCKLIVCVYIYIYIYEILVYLLEYQPEPLECRRFGVSI